MKLFELIDKENTQQRFFLDISCIESISILPTMNEGDAPVAKIRTKSGAKHTVDANSLFTAINTPSSHVLTIQAPAQEAE
ncbi:MAG: hypothetical protein ACRDCE_01585 [Cetobacterium sp.]|uniref:hypothetical protein n=1 Tax=Cetobacterium sp. TaxID=2071632 RepID=UPI003EE487AB